MDNLPPASLPKSPTLATGLRQASPSRVNRDMSNISRSEFHESAVSDKISQFNSLSNQSRAQIERRYNARNGEKNTKDDAALRRAAVGREELETEMRKYREEARTLRRKLDDGQERERKIAERLDTLMDNHGRAKETYAHTQELWEKEIRRTRKEAFKAQSTTVKLQEELKHSRDSLSIAQQSLEREKERSKIRENEAFTARYQMVEIQEQLDAALARIKVVEQERDSFKTLAKKEEVARIAAEGMIPLPPGSPDDEFATPRKEIAVERIPETMSEKPRNKATEKLKRPPGGRVSISTMDIVSSEASEMEIEELSRQVLWERQRADRAQELLDFMQMECQLRCCPCIKEVRAEEKEKAEQKAKAAAEERERQEEEGMKREVEQLRMEREEAWKSSRSQSQHEREAEREEKAQIQTCDHDMDADLGHHNHDDDSNNDEVLEEDHNDMLVSSMVAPAASAFSAAPSSIYSSRVSPCPIFPAPTIAKPSSPPLSHSVSSKESTIGGTIQDENRKPINASSRSGSPRDRSSTVYFPEESVFRTMTNDMARPMDAAYEAAPCIQAAKDTNMDIDDSMDFDRDEMSMGSFDGRYAHTPSLETSSFTVMAKQRVSLLSLLNAPHDTSDGERESLESPLPNIPTIPDDAASASQPYPAEPEVRNIVPSYVDDSFVNARTSFASAAETEVGADSTTSISTPYAVETVTTTTKIPLREETRSPTIADQLRNQMRNSHASFDASNPAMTPTMTREEALAQIRERRGRARSAAQGTTTPRRQMTQGVKKMGSSAGSARPMTTRRDVSSGSAPASAARVASRPPSRMAATSRSTSRTTTKLR
ncbi:Caldesmon [Ceratocystis lukuohia]|uniref:Caldesmon n=1 Tax=Ceratocystis lukuohia TaxID=2019550 RepID=A0ABR4MF61_9PEZI